MALWGWGTNRVQFSRHAYARPRKKNSKVQQQPELTRANTFTVNRAVKVLQYRDRDDEMMMISTGRLIEKPGYTLTLEQSERIKKYI